MPLGPRQALQKFGPLLTVRFGLADPDPDTWQAFGEPIPEPIALTALIDTGASHTTLRRGATARLRIPPTAVLGIDGVDGPMAEEAPGYFGHLLFTKVGNASESLVLPCTVFEGLPLDSRVDCLIGRDVLMQGRLTYDGMGARCELRLRGEQVQLLPLPE